MRPDGVPPALESRLDGDPLAAIPSDSPAATTWRRRLWSTRIDTRPLRTSRDFRLLWLSGAVSFLGSMVTYVAAPFQVYDLTGSALLVGMLGAAELVPLVVFGLYGGALADAVDRRRMVLLTEAAFTLLPLALLLNSLLDSPHVWPIFMVASLVAALDGLQRPSLDALVPRIVATDELAAASALTSVRMNLGMIAGPAIGGVIVATAGVTWAYAVDIGTFLVALVGLSLMRAVPAPSGAQKPSLRGIAEGVRYALSRRELLGTYVVDLAAMLFAMPVALYPALARDVLAAPWALGLLYSAGSVGSLVATLTSGWTGSVHRHGRAIATAAAVWGAAVALVGLVGNVWLVMGLLAVAGAADMVSGLFRSVIWNSTIPDELRGRLAGIELLSYSIGPLGGNVRAGSVAAMWSVRGSVLSGGLLCIAAVAALTAALPTFASYDDRTNEHAVRERRRRARQPDVGT